MKSKELKINLYSVFIVLIALFMISTLTYDLLPIKTVNKVLGFFVFAVSFLIILNRMSIYRFCVLMLSLTLGVTSCVLAYDATENFKNMIYWLLCIFIFLILSNKKDMWKMCTAIESTKKFLLFSVILCDIILLGGLFISRCYSSNWSGSYYCGFSASQHTVCSGACLTMAIVFLFFEKEKAGFKKMLLLVPGILAILASGARTFLISLLCMVGFYYMLFIKKKSIKLLILPFIVFAGIYLFFRSGIYEKFLFVTGDASGAASNFAQKVTSGRTVFWAIDINAFLDLEFIYKLLGKGFDYVFRVNENQYGLAIWAHNDIINLLLSVGLIGTLLYVVVMWRAVRCCVRVQKSRIVKWIFVAYIVLPMLLNGLYAYQHYLYSIIVLMIVTERANDNSETKENISGMIPNQTV